MQIVDDVHCMVSATRVQGVICPSSVEELQAAIRSCVKKGATLSVAGGRHSLGRQPFSENGILIDLANFGRVVELDSASGILSVQGGCLWPTVHQFLKQTPASRHWEVHQKQTGADTISIAGSIAANAHGNPLRRGPISSDIQWLKLVTADGTERYCDRQVNAELFALTLGGFGLFGIVSGIGLRLAKRQVFRRHSHWSDAERFAEIAQGREEGSYAFSYADMQLDIAPSSPTFFAEGMLNAWEPVEHSESDAKQVTLNDWQNLVTLAHHDIHSAVQHYRATTEQLSGQIETRDHFMWHAYAEGYHQQIESQLSMKPGGDLLAEFFIPPNGLAELLTFVRDESQRHRAEIILATLRSAKACQDSFLRWAKEDYVCLVMAMHFEKERSQLDRLDHFCNAVAAYCAENNGSYYLPYRVRPSREAFARAYPNFDDFVARKQYYDPSCLFSNEWFRSYREAYFGRTLAPQLNQRG
jgi:FAD/FMN-containing dehydrogenase